MRSCVCVAGLSQHAACVCCMRGLRTTLRPGCARAARTRCRAPAVLLPAPVRSCALPALARSPAPVARELQRRRLCTAGFEPPPRQRNSCAAHAAAAAAARRMVRSARANTRRRRVAAVAPGPLACLQRLTRLCLLLSATAPTAAAARSARLQPACVAASPSKARGSRRRMSACPHTRATIPCPQTALPCAVRRAPDAVRRARELQGTAAAPLRLWAATSAVFVLHRKVGCTRGLPTDSTSPATRVQ